MPYLYIYYESAYVVAPTTQLPFEWLIPLWSYYFFKFEMSKADTHPCLDGMRQFISNTTYAMGWHSTGLIKPQLSNGHLSNKLF